MDRGRGRRDVARPPRLRTPAALPRGPRLYSEPKDKGYIGPVSEPPPGFVQGTTSETEWRVYHAIARVLGEPEDPYSPPFIGSPGSWAYQKAWDDGRRQAGGSVIDFLVYGGGRSDDDVAFRVQTEHFHLYADASVHEKDAIQLARLTEFMRVVDLYDQDFMFDPTNQATIILIKEALAGNTFPNPITNGTTQRATRMNLIST